MQNWLCFWRTYLGYVALLSPDRPNRATTRKLLLRHLYPCVQDATANHEIEPIYFYQDAWAFELIVRAQPAQHIDVGSHHKFVALLSKVVPVTMVDIRPLSLELSSLQFRAGSSEVFGNTKKPATETTSFHPRSPYAAAKAAAQYAVCLAKKLCTTLCVENRALRRFTRGDLLRLQTS